MNELINIDTVKPTELFAEGGIDAIISKIETEARATLIDISTEAGRKDCASLAYKIARSKTALDDMGKELVAEWKNKSAKVDGERRKIRDRLDALKDEIRKPLTDFEDAEKARVTQHEDLIAAISALPTFDGYQPTTDQIQERLAVLSRHMQRDWEEFAKRATEIADTARLSLQQHLAARQKYDADQAELQRLRVEQTKREQAEREERIRKEAAEAAQKAAAAAIADAKAREEAAQRQAEQTRVDAEKAAHEAAQRAEAAKAEAAAREQRAKEEAAKAERERIERQQREETAATAKREANKKHRAQINRAAAAAIVNATGISDEQSKAVIEAIAKNAIPNVTVNY